MKNTPKPTGFSLLELVVSISIMSVIVVMISMAMKNPFRAVMEYRIRATADTETRSAMSAITKLLRTGSPNSVLINGWDLDAAAFSGLFYSHIRFHSQTTKKTYDIYLTQQTPRELRLQDNNGGLAKTICRNVSYLAFNVDFRDPSVIVVSLRTETPLGARAENTHVIELLNHSVRLGSTI